MSRKKVDESESEEEVEAGSSSEDDIDEGTLLSCTEGVPFHSLTPHSALQTSSHSCNKTKKSMGPLTPVVEGLVASRSTLRARTTALKMKMTMRKRRMPRRAKTMRRTLLETKRARARPLRSQCHRSSPLARKNRLGVL